MSLDELVESALAGALSRYFESRSTFDEKFIDSIANKVCDKVVEALRREESLKAQQAHAAMKQQLMNQQHMNQYQQASLMGKITGGLAK